MTRRELLAFLRKHRLAIEASHDPSRGPQAAVVGFAVSDDLEIVFDTLTTSRKYRNLMADPRIALVIGWDHEATAQVEGIVDIPTGDERERIRACYFAVYPDGRERMKSPDLVHIRVRPTWVRHSDFAADPPRIVELTGAELPRF
jgi:general stress protein 26